MSAELPMIEIDEDALGLASFTGQGEVVARLAGSRGARRSLVDARRLYRLALDREPAAGDILAGFGDLKFEDHLRAFFNAPEFLSRVVTPLLSTGGAELNGAPGRGLATWASRRLPLTDSGRCAVAAQADNWRSLYLEIFSDEAFRTLFAPDHPIAAPAFLKALRHAVAFRGSLDEAQPDFVRGWVARLDGDPTPLRIEVWVDGAFTATGQPTIFRRDVQDLFGGDGIYGFEIAVPAPSRDLERSARFEVREAGSGFVVGSTLVNRKPASIDGLTTIAMQIREVRQTLERLERQIPVVQNQLGSSLENYDSHYARWFRQDAATPVDVAITVFIDGHGTSIRALNDAIYSVVDQAGTGAALILMIDAAGHAAALDIVNRAAWRGLVRVRIVLTTAADRAASVMETIRELDDNAVVLLARADCVLAGNALSEVTEAFASVPDHHAIYGDHDEYEPDDLSLDAGRRRHVKPALKPAFDADLFHQTPYVGSCIAFRAGALRSAGLRAEAGDHYTCDALLRLDSDKIGHGSRILYTTWPSSEEMASEWADCITHHFATQGVTPHVVAHTDVLGAKLKRAIRVLYSAPEVARVAIIIPTRDRIDLIKPCVDSLLQHLDASRLEVEILVVDHQNSVPEVLDYLSDLQTRGSIRILPFEGQFNWALMNNLAAAQTEADVLIFLNDDTVVISPDWIDELAAQALRPEVGVVGCRLIYADATIQHAGFVLRETQQDFLIHDGVGVPGSNGGYLGRHALLHAVVAVTGACMAVSRNVFRGLGGFDAANFPVEGNDVDFCFRAAAAGLTVLYDPYATLYHLESKTRGFSADGERRRVSETAVALLWERWGQGFGPDPGFNPNFDRWGRPFVRLRPPIASSVQAYPPRR